MLMQAHLTKHNITYQDTTFIFFSLSPFSSQTNSSYSSNCYSNFGLTRCSAQHNGFTPPPTPPPPKKKKSLLQNRQLQKIGEFSSRKKVPPYLLKGRRARLIHVYYHPNNHKKYCLLYTFITSDQDVALIKRASEAFSLVIKKTT